MTAHFWKAVVAAALLQVALAPASAAPQGISVYSSTDEKGEQHTSVHQLNPQQSQALAAQHAQMINQQQSALGSLFGNLFGNLFGSGHTAPAPQAQRPTVVRAPVPAPASAPKPVPAPAPSSPQPSSRTPCAGCGVA